MSTQKNAYLASYGSDCDSCVGNEETTYRDSKSLNSSETGVETTITTSQAYTSEMATLTEESLQRLLNKFKEEIKTDNKNTINTAIEEGVKSIKEDLATLTSFKAEIQSEVTTLNSDVSGMKTEISSLQNELATVKRDLALCKIGIKENAGTNIRQEQRADECCSKLEEIDDKLNSNLLRIRGIVEKKGENCIRKVNEFFKNTLGIEQNIKIKRAHRIGKGANRNILVHLKNTLDKGLIFSKMDKLKDVTNENNKPFSVSNQLSARKHAERMRMRYIKRTNDTSAGEKLNITAERGVLKIDGEEYIKLAQPPPLRDILWPTTEKMKERIKLDPTKGEIIKVEGQMFLGYTAEVRTVDDVNKIYAKIRSLHTDARHVICAFRLPHRNFHTHQDFIEDGEYGGGSYLLQLLSDSDVMNRAIYVVRIYNGKHLGSKRFEAMKNAAMAAVAAAPKNSITDNFDLIWERNDKINKPNYGGSIRGGRHNVPTLNRSPKESADSSAKNAWDKPLQLNIEQSEAGMSQPETPVPVPVV